MNRREEFLNKLQLLLEEFGAEISADDHYQGYAECGQDIRMTVEFDDFEIKEINLGTWIDKKKDWDKLL